jgi:hypothetical protein
MNLNVSKISYKVQIAIKISSKVQIAITFVPAYLQQTIFHMQATALESDPISNFCTQNVF